MDIKDDLLSYYCEIRSSLKTFDDIISKFVLQGATVILALITASLLAYREKDYLVSISILVGSIIITVAMYLKSKIYNDIQSIGIDTAIEVERKMFRLTRDEDMKISPGNEMDQDKVKYRLTENLRKNRKNRLGKHTRKILQGIFVVLLIFEVTLGCLILLHNNESTTSSEKGTSTINGTYINVINGK